MKKFFSNMWIAILSMFQGIHQLLMDPAGTICLLVLGAVSFLCYEKRIGDVSFAAVAGIVPAVVALVKHSSFNGADIDKHSLANRNAEEPQPPPLNPAKNVAPNPQ